MRSFIIAFACGVLFLQTRGSLPSFALTGIVGVAGVAFLFAARRYRAAVSLAATMTGGFLLGFAWGAGVAHQRLSDALPHEWETRTIRLSGVVAALPQRSLQGERFVFDVEDVLTADARVPRKIMLSWRRAGGDGIESEAERAETAQAVRPGERWQLSVRLRRPHGNANPYGNDYEAWLIERGIRAVGSVYARGENTRIDPFVFRPAYLVQAFRERIRRNFISALPDAPYLGVLIALSIGDQGAITPAQWEVFRRTGITHLVSISGLHVTMVGALFGWLVNRLWRRSARLMYGVPAQKAALSAAFLAALAYSLLAGFEVPTQRTFYMLAVALLALLSGKNIGLARTLLLALFAVLMLDPWAVLSPGFWLSFGAVALLFFVGSVHVVKRRGWRKIFMEWSIAQWGVTLGSIPLLLLFFQQFSLVSPLVNAFAIPVVGALVTPLALLFTIVPWPPLLAVDHGLLFHLMRLVESLAAWPVWQQAAPPFWAILTAIPGVVLLLCPKGFPGRPMGIFLLLPALLMRPERPADGDMWVDVLDVGQGLAVVVRTAKHTLLYDTGPVYSPESNAGTRVLTPFMQALGIDRIDTLIVSHSDNDHAGGMDAIRAAFPVRRFLRSMDVSGGERCIDGENWEWDGARFDLLHPASGDYAETRKKSNNMSCVLRVSNRSGSVVLTGDIAAADEKRMIGRMPPERLRSTVLIVPHHGSRTSSSRAFIAAVAPEEAIFSAGYRNRFGHPAPRVVERYRASRVWRTDRDGAIRITFADRVETSAWRSERKRYWHGR